VGAEIFGAATEANQMGRRYIWIVILLVAGGIALVAWIIMAKPPAIRLPMAAQDRQERVTSLAKLLNQNQITDLPDGFNLWADRNKIECFQARDEDGTVYQLVKMTCRLEEGSSITCSFVFDRTGKCIFWSRDSYGMENGGLLDINYDGYVEKIVEFMSGASAAPGQLDSRLQIFKLSPDGAEKLLDLAYATWPAKAADDFINTDVSYSWSHGGYAIKVSRDLKPDEQLLIRWSADEQRYVAEGTVSPYWKLLPTGTAETDAMLGPGVACPRCGYTPTEDTTTCPMCMYEPILNNSK
jgi:hypothetical protein